MNINIDVIGFNNIRSFINRDTDKMGLIDTNGNIILDAEFDVIHNFEKYGIAIFEKDNSGGLLNSKGQIIIDNVKSIKINKLFTLVYCFEDIKTGLFGLVNIYGTIILPAEYKYISEINKNGVFGVNKDDINISINYKTNGIKIEKISETKYSINSETNDMIIEKIY